MNSSSTVVTDRRGYEFLNISIYIQIFYGRYSYIKNARLLMILFGWADINMAHGWKNLLH